MKLYTSKYNYSKNNDIWQFKDEYSFLSNFFKSPFEYSNMIFKTVEHFYQAFKTDDYELFNKIIKCNTPAQTKKIGKTIKLRPNWDTHHKQFVMKTGLIHKFSQNPMLAKALIDTYPKLLIEGNYWNDTYWGVCLKTDYGQNILGIMLMDIRDTLIKQRGGNVN